MKVFLIFAVSLTTICATAQMLHKNKYSTLNALIDKGYTYAKDDNNPNIYWYRRYDSYGESIVQLTFEANTFRKAVIVHLDPTQTLNRLKDVYIKTTNAEADTFDPPSNGYGKGEASNTPYYSGKARYECNNNYSTKDYLFIIIALD
jgi:hypothetical protein